MLYKQLKISVLLLFILTGIHAQTIYVKQNNDTQVSYTLDSLQKITFSSGKLNIYKTDYDTETYTLSDVQYLSFQDYTVGISQTTFLQANLTAYPNPVSDFLHIDLSTQTKEGVIQILSIEGRILQEQKTKGNTVVVLDVSRLSSGMYLCRFFNASEIKTVKIIKP